MVHRGHRSLNHKIRQFLYKNSFFDPRQKETICMQDAVIPATETITVFGNEYNFVINTEAVKGEILRDRQGQGTLQKM